MTDDELRRAIAKILTPKPWAHAKTYMWYGKGSTCVSNAPPGRWVGNPCGRCKEPVYNELGCREPPPMTDSWPVLAERLTGQCQTTFGLTEQIFNVPDLCGPSRAAVLSWWLDLTAKYKCELLVKAMRKQEPVHA